jgi:hypothetical protein
MPRTTAGVILALFFVGLGAACAPAYQDARIVPPGEVAITPSVSPVMATFEGRTDHVANQFGVHAILGVAGRFDVGLGYARFQVAGDTDAATNILGFGPRYGLVRGRIAAIAPFGFAFGGGVDAGETFQVQPGLQFTTPISRHVDFNPSVRLIVPFCQGCDMQLAFNLGFGIGSPARRTVFRPEIGFAVNPGDGGMIWSFGAGVSLRARLR